MLQSAFYIIKMITQEELSSIFEYIVEKDEYYWKIPRRGISIGDKLDTAAKYTSIYGKRYTTNTLIGIINPSNISGITKISTPITYDELIKVLEYNSTTGIFIWKENRKAVHKGDIAGHIKNSGYVEIRVGGTTYLAHRLAWLYFYKKWPDNEIDHIDRNPTNNSISNLRDVTLTENNQNQRKPHKSNNATVGKIEALVVLIEFADRSAYFSRNEVDSFFNQVGYNKYHDNGSIHDYWAAVSQNRINVHTNVSAAYYKAPKSFDYYDTDGGGHTHELIDSALNWLDKQGFDFSKLTVDANKNIKGLSFQFVGNSGAKGLWGHSSYHGRTFDGVNTASYQISELGTTEMHLGGICHEQGHMLFGWPDTYDIDASNGGSSGCGKFDLMAGGNSDNTGAPSGNPMPPNPYFRYLAGWNDMIPMNKFPNDTVLKIIANSGNTYVYRNPDRAGEMYIIEARKKPYRNVDMPGDGLLVWHIDSVISNNANQQHTEQQHYKVSVVQADSRYELESGTNNGDALDYFKLGGITTLSVARTYWWNGASSGLQIRNIRNASDTMAVSYGSENATDVAIKSTRSLGGTLQLLIKLIFHLSIKLSI